MSNMLQKREGWDAERRQLVKDTYCKGATDQEFELFAATCNRLGLSPEGRQVYAVMRYDNVLRREAMTVQVSIDGFRLSAERSGKYAGQRGPFWCGEDGVWKDVWLAKELPAAAKIGVVRKGFDKTLWGVATFRSYAQRKRDGSLTKMWQTMPDVMIAKCAEALALRKAFPQELSGIYTTDEMGQADNAIAIDVDHYESVPQEKTKPQAPPPPPPPQEDKASSYKKQLGEAIAGGPWGREELERYGVLKGYTFPISKSEHWEDIINTVKTKTPGEALA